MFKLIASLVFVTSAFASEIPHDIQAFYDSLNGSRTACAELKILESRSTYPRLVVYFYKNGVNYAPNPFGHTYSEVKAFGTTFKPSYDIWVDGEFEKLRFTTFEKKKGVEKAIITLVKDSTGKLVEVSYRTSARNLNWRGYLKPTWDAQGFYQYHCKNDQLEMTLGE